jgi:hypothetical protein
MMVRRLHEDAGDAALEGREWGGMRARVSFWSLAVVSMVFSLAASAQGLRFTEEFVDVSALSEWVVVNNSDVAGSTDWFQGSPDTFTAKSGEPDEYIAANFNATSGSSISLWLIFPEITFEPTASVSFWTRTVTGSIFPDGLQVRVSTAGSSTSVGSTSTSVGDFTNLELEINPTLAVGGYPETWTLYTLPGIGSYPPGSGRIAFRYFVSVSAGPSGDNSNYVGIDRAYFDIAVGRIFFDDFESGGVGSWSTTQL